MHINGCAGSYQENWIAWDTTVPTTRCILHMLMLLQLLLLKNSLTLYGKHVRYHTLQVCFWKAFYSKIFLQDLMSINPYKILFFSQKRKMYFYSKFTSSKVFQNCWCILCIWLLELYQWWENSLIWLTVYKLFTKKHNLPVSGPIALFEAYF